MPIHDWTRVDAGLFHDFHQGWTATLSNIFNSGGLPPDYYSLLDQRIQGSSVRLIHRKEAEIYAGRANRLTVRHQHGDVVAVIEIVSPGNKGSRSEFLAFVQKSAEFIRQGVHLLLIDLFPPGSRDLRGVHGAIWDEFEEIDFALPPDKPLTLASYDAGPPRVAYVQFVAVGDPLPAMPLFLQSEFYVSVPLEATYQATWAVFPTALKGLLEVPAPQSNTGHGPAHE